MSAVSTSRPKKVDHRLASPIGDPIVCKLVHTEAFISRLDKPLSKKVPENPKYKNVRSTIDTGASVTKYMEKIEDIRSNYRYKKDEVFKRMKVTTFVQLVIQVAEYDHSRASTVDNGNYRPDTADREIQMIQRGGGAGDRSPARSPALTEGDYGAPAVDTSRSTLQGVIKGTGELDRLPHPHTSQNTDKTLDGCPYLLLDIREKDAFEQCHIVTAKNYPSAMLSRAVNYETKEMLAFKNQPGKIIVLYDEDERLAPTCASTLVERLYDNIFLLSGGMKVAYKIFPEGLLTGTPPLVVSETPRPSAESRMADKDRFDQSDLDNLNVYLDSQLMDKSSGSRLSKASTTASRMSNYSRQSKDSQSVVTGRVSGRAPFKP